MLGRLRMSGWQIIESPEAADVILVNTCSFIEAAANESIDTILALAAYKKTGACRRLIVTGCLPERYQEDLAESLPEVDVFLGTGAYDEIERAVRNSLPQGVCLLPDPNRTTLETAQAPRVLSSPHLAYLKVAEGCAGRCTYCIIPKLRGNHRSRPLADVVAEARSLVGVGVRELVLVAQDTTRYGGDLTPPADLNRLLLALSDLSEDIWIRFLYGHPSRLDTATIKTVAERDNICSYFDLPIQHASDRVLRRMGREYTRQDLLRLFDTIAELAPEAALRTTVMVGFPGETEADVDALISFMEAVRFDHLGAFAYSDAEDLPSHRLSGHVPEKIVQSRLDRVMRRQQEISEETNGKFLDQTLTVLVEEQLETNLFLGRHALQAPEVDGTTYIHVKAPQEMITIGEFVQVRIFDTLAYDLAGNVL